MTQEFEVRIPASVRHAGLVRRFFGVLAEECRAIRLAPLEITEVELVLQEACVNAIRHAPVAAAPGEIRVVFRVAEDRITIDVHDGGPGFDPDAVPVPRAEALQEGGYGVFIMKESMDRVVGRRETDGFVLSLTRKFRKTPRSTVRAGER